MACPLRVGEIMNTPPITAPPSASVLETARLMDTYGVGSVVVVDEEKRPLGLFTRRELVWIVARLACDGLKEEIGSHMNKSFPVLSREECIDAAAMEMSSYGVRHAPVVDRMGSVVGVVSLDDIAREVARRFQEFRERAVEEMLRSEELVSRLLGPLLRSAGP